MSEEVSDMDEYDEEKYQEISQKKQEVGDALKRTSILNVYKDQHLKQQLRKLQEKAMRKKQLEEMKRLKEWETRKTQIYSKQFGIGKKNQDITNYLNLKTNTSQTRSDSNLLKNESLKSLISPLSAILKQN